MDTELPARILQCYGLKARHIAAVQRGYRSQSFAVALMDGELINVIIYKAEPGIVARIRQANRLGEHLATAGLPTRQPLDRRLLKLQGPHQTNYAGIYTYLPGTTIPWEAYTMSHLKQLGASLAEMHQSLAKLKRSNLPTVTDEYLAIIARMQQYFSEPSVRVALANKLGLLVQANFGRYQQLLNQVAQLPGQQALHMDFVRGNVLFTPDEAIISGIIDFEKAAWGLPLFDIGRTLAFLLVDCKYKQSTEINKYFLRSGYAKRGAGQLPNHRLLQALINLFLLYDLYKFLRHNPYESLLANEHYMRTIAELTRRQLVTASENC